MSDVPLSVLDALVTRNLPLPGERLVVRFAVEALQDAVYLLQAFDPEAIILQGSLARGEWDEASDVDLLVIMHPGDHETQELLAHMELMLDELPMRADLQIWTPRKLARMRNLSGKLRAHSLRGAVMLWRKPDA